VVLARLPDEIEEAESEGVEFRFLAAPLEIVRDGDDLEEVVFQEMELGEPDDSGRRRPVPIEGKTFTLPVDRLFTAIGETADLEALGGGVETEWNLVKAAGPYGETSRKMVFAGGDVVTGAASVVEAVAAGREAAGKIARLLSGAEDPAQEEEQVVGIEDMNTAYFEHSNRVQVPRIAADKAVKGFGEIYTGFEPEMLARETERCFSCGVCNFCDNCWIFCPDVAIKRLEDEYEVDYDYCKGCLVCVVECPRNCISTREEGK